jgi:hypothetical protein
MKNLVTFNLNCYAIVKLSESGVACLLKHRAVHGNIHGKFDPVNLVLTAQVWELMEIFGPVIYHGAQMSPFVDNYMTVNTDV